MASSLGLLYVLIAFEVENRKSFKASAPAGATFRVDAPYFLMMIGVVIFLLLSILAIVLALLPEEKKEAEKAA
jgi:cbb3-type cytochrome oxidase subunit 3